MDKASLGFWLFGAALAGTAAVSVLDPFATRAPQQPPVTAMETPADPEPQEPVKPEPGPAATAANTPAAVTEPGPATQTEVAAADPAPETPAAAAVAPAGVPVPAPELPAAANEVSIPRFDLLRAEPDGSLVVAGSAAIGARIEILSGSSVLAETVAGDGGDFVAILDEPLGAGDYQIVLRATGPDGAAATSVETAIVSIPEASNGQVLALVEAPGQASRLITAPQAGASALVPVEPSARPATVAAEPAPAAATTDAAETAPVETEVATAPVAEPAPAASPAAAPAAPPADVRIEAVEIDGGTVFVAGAATAGARLRVYANEILLGETVASETGRFLVEVRRDLAVGDYIIRADVIDKTGADVLVRASVPFVRGEGERLAAVAVPPAPVLPAAPPSIPFEIATGAPDSSGTGISVPQALGVLQGPPVIESGALVPTGQSVIIRKGDTLWQISRRVYGRGVKYTTIYAANADQIGDPDRIWPGQVFAVPGEGDDDAAALERHLQLRTGN